jgi:hypothetical protein
MDLEFKHSHEELLEKINLGKFFYLMDYAEHYKKFLKDVSDIPKVISELFFFRAWTTQLGFKLFLPSETNPEKFSLEISNQDKIFGKKMLFHVNRIDIEKTLNDKFINLLDDRWDFYDKIYFDFKDENPPVPVKEICGKLMEYCGIDNNEKLNLLQKDFSDNLEQIKQELIKLEIVK